MDYYHYRIHSPETDPAILLAFLADLPFDSFEEQEDVLNAYLPAALDSATIGEKLDELKQTFPFQWERLLVPHQNWNEIWESNFQPIQVGDFCGIRADFHAPLKEVAHEIIINPRMAFGTGHHATTFMVIQLMESIDFTQKKVLDYGCGTGVLAILAAMRGANPVVAIDIDQECYQNTLDNAAVNNVQGIQTLHGTLPDVDDDGYEIILANINRNVILETVNSLYQKLKPGGVLLVSGILKQDEPLIVQKAESQNFKHIRQTEKDGWLGIWFEK